jgi:hypothetical protein
MQDKFRLYRRPNGMFYAEEYQTRHRESLQTKDEAKARRLIAAKNQAATQPVFNLEMAKVYLKAHDPQLCERTWSLVSDAVQHTYEGSTKARWEKFIRSEPVQGVIEKKLVQTTSCDFLAVLNHPVAAFPLMSFFVSSITELWTWDGSFSPSLRKRAGLKFATAIAGESPEEHDASWRSPSERTIGFSLSCFGRPAVLRRILRV